MLHGMAPSNFNHDGGVVATTTLASVNVKLMLFTACQRVVLSISRYTLKNNHNGLVLQHGVTELSFPASRQRSQDIGLTVNTTEHAWNGIIRIRAIHIATSGPRDHDADRRRFSAQHKHYM
jgi:hypothetical protein